MKKKARIVLNVITKEYYKFLKAQLHINKEYPEEYYNANTLVEQVFLSLIAIVSVFLLQCYASLCFIMKIHCFLCWLQAKNQRSQEKIKKKRKKELLESLVERNELENSKIIQTPENLVSFQDAVTQLKQYEHLIQRESHQYSILSRILTP